MTAITSARRLSRRFGHVVRAPARRLHRAREGLAVLELALVMPLVVILIMAAADVGILFFGYVNAGNALREGARCGAVGYSDAAVVQRVEELSGYSDPVSVVVSDRSTALIGDEFTVIGSFDHDWITPIVGGLGLTQYVRTATIRLETDEFDRAGCVL